MVDIRQQTELTIVIDNESGREGRLQILSKERLLST